MLITQMLAISQIWLKVKSVFKFIISILSMRQLIDNFYWYIAVKGNLEKQKITTLMGKITAAALVGTRAPTSQKHNNTQNCLPSDI